MNIKIITWFVFLILISCGKNSKTQRFKENYNKKNKYLFIRKNGMLSYRDTIIEYYNDSVFITFFNKLGRIKQYYVGKLTTNEKNTIDAFIKNNKFVDSVGYYIDGNNSIYRNDSIYRINLFFGNELYISTDMYNVKTSKILKKITDFEVLLIMTDSILKFKKLIKKKFKRESYSKIRIKSIIHNADTIPLSSVDKYQIWKSLLNNPLNQITLSAFKHENLNKITYVFPFNNKPSITELYINDKYLFITDINQKSYLIKHNINSKVYKDILRKNRIFEPLILY